MAAAHLIQINAGRQRVIHAASDRFHAQEQGRTQMNALSNDELQNVIRQLDQAIYTHEQWSKTLFRTLICRQTPDSHDLRPDAHHHCLFGQWYYEHAPAGLREHAGFVAIEGEHARMHKLAANLLLAAANDGEIMSGQYDDFSNALDRLRLQLMTLKRELQDQMFNRDPLTGAYTRLGMLTRLRETQALTMRTGLPCALAMMDLDHFKVVNDTWGHAAGDAMLAGTAKALMAMLRPYDVLYRFGGEEFLVSLPNTSVEVARPVVDRLRECVAGTAIQFNSHSLSITASFGLAALAVGEPVERSIDRADAALYAAKAAGRNRVVIWEAGMERK
jgi:diguanylate cyclase (GGDEF)-like protein